MRVRWEKKDGYGSDLQSLSGKYIAKDVHQPCGPAGISRSIQYVRLSYCCMLSAISQALSSIWWYVSPALLPAKEVIDAAASIAK